MITPCVDRAAAVIESRRLSRKWCSENAAPPAIESRLQGALLRAIVKHGALAASDVEVIAHETTQDFAHAHVRTPMVEQRARARAMVREWRGTPGEVGTPPLPGQSR